MLVEPSNQLQSSDTSGRIAWTSDDVFAKVMGKERKGCICGVGFGPSPNGRSSKSAFTDLQIRSSQPRDDEVAQLKASLAEMQEKLSAFDEMKERLSQFEEMEQRMARMLQQMQQITSQCSQVGINVCLIPLIGYFYNFHSPLYNSWMNVKINIRNPKAVAAHPVTPNTSLIAQ